MADLVLVTIIGVVGSLLENVPMRRYPLTGERVVHEDQDYEVLWVATLTNAGEVLIMVREI